MTNRWVILNLVRRTGIAIAVLSSVISAHLYATQTHASESNAVNIKPFQSDTPQIHSQQLRLITESWPPVSYQDNGKAKGFAVDLVNQLQHFVDMNTEPEIMPWARAISIALTTPNVMLFSTSIDSTRKQQFDFVGPILSSRVSLYALSEDEIKIDSIEALRNVGAIGVYRSTVGVAILEQAELSNIQLASFPEHSAKQLFRGRIRLWCQADVAVGAILEKLNIDPSAIKSVFDLAEIDLYLAFSQGTDQHIVEHWAEALTAFKASGKFEALYAKYFDVSNIPDHVEIIWREESFEQ